MDISQEFLNELNSAYGRLAEKHTELMRVLSGHGFDVTSGWFNGHYKRTADGTWDMEQYPIPVINVNRLSDIEIDFSGISVTNKLTRDAASEYSFDLFSTYKFEAYGVDDYLSDFYHDGLTIQELKANIQSSAENEIGFQFFLPFDIEEGELIKLLKLFQQEGFYY